MAAAFTRNVIQILEQLNRGALMMPADFARIRPLTERKVAERIEGVFAQYREARQKVRDTDAPAMLPSAVIAAHAAEIACEVWMEYGKQSRQELAKN